MSLHSKQYLFYTGNIGIYLARFFFINVSRQKICSSRLMLNIMLWNWTSWVSNGIRNIEYLHVCTHMRTCLLPWPLVFREHFMLKGTIHCPFLSYCVLFCLLAMLWSFLLCCWNTFLLHKWCELYIRILYNE